MLAVEVRTIPQKCAKRAAASRNQIEVKSRLYSVWVFRFLSFSFQLSAFFIMTIVATEDKRNQEWRKSNVGLKLLEKMGYKDGEGIGKRNTNNTALRALKRKEGLGLGAKIESEGGNSESTNHFSAVLTSLQAHHETTPTKKSKKKKKKIRLPQNKVTAGHASKMREAKFGAKSAEDMACIFGNSSIVLDIKPIGVAENTNETKKKKKKRKMDDEALDAEKTEKKKKEKKRRKEEEKKEKSKR